MRPDRLPGSVRGFGLVAALFVMIVVSLVVIAMARLAATQHGSNSLAIQQARAYQAARAGLEWGLSQAVRNRACAAGNPALADGSLGDFVVVVACVNSNYLDDDGSAVQILNFTATAQNGAPGARPDYAYRRLTATVEL